MAAPAPSVNMSALAIRSSNSSAVLGASVAQSVSMNYGQSRPLVNPHAYAGSNLGVPYSPLEPYTSMDPKDYVWGNPTPHQQQQLYQQFMQLAFMYCVSQQPNGVAPMPGQTAMPFSGLPYPPVFPQCQPGTAFCNPPARSTGPLTTGSAAAQKAGVAGLEKKAQIARRLQQKNAAAATSASKAAAVAVAPSPAASQAAATTPCPAVPIAGQWSSGANPAAAVEAPSHQDFLDCDFDLSADDIKRLLEDTDDVADSKAVKTGTANVHLVTAAVAADASPMMAHSPTGSDGSTDTVEKGAESATPTVSSGHDEILLFSDMDDLSFSSVNAVGSDATGFEEVAELNTTAQPKRPRVDVSEEEDCKRRKTLALDDALDTFTGFLSDDRCGDWEASLQLTEPPLDLGETICQPLEDLA